MKKISLIGSTGSIGKQVCNVVRRYPEKFKIESLIANASAEVFLEQVKEFQPKYAVLIDKKAGERISKDIPRGIRFFCGEEYAEEAISFGDIAMIAVSGFAGLQYSLWAIEQKKEIALANKETLVCGGELITAKSKQAGIDLIPVDSEHSALWQALHFKKDAPFQKLLLTASGGPFYGYTKEQLQKVTAKDALRHPTWQMGAKITIDSATLLNKGFEVIEAKWLYGCDTDKITTVVHPQSIIHSMVEFEDGAVLAQMSYPTMELPIQLALTFPQRLPCNLPSLDFEKLGSLRFLPFAREDFPCYDLALRALETGDNYPCALNGAGEIAVHAFLEGKIPFLAISDTMKYALEKINRMPADTYEALKQTDNFARAFAKEYVKSL